MSRDAYRINAENILRRFPMALREDPAMEAFARIASDELEARVPETELPNIYNHIDELPEEILDALAVDLKVDWYNYNFGLEAKRELIKSSPYVHRFLGTPAAVNRMLSSVYPGSYIEEWFNYGGEPHHFQVVIETKAAREPANADDILRAVRMVKRLSSHLDGIVYQCDMSIVIETEARGYKARHHWTGRHDCGTIYDRAVKGGIEDDAVRVITSGSAHESRADMAGTKPYRTAKGGVHSALVDIETEEAPLEVSVHAAGKDRAGTVPNRATAGGTASGAIAVETGTESFHARSALAGTKPDRTTLPGIQDTVIQAATLTEPFRVRSPVSGRREEFRPEQIVPGLADAGATIRTTAKWFDVLTRTPDSDVPIRQRPSGGLVLPGGLCAYAEAEPFRYSVYWCGRGHCRQSGARFLRR